MTVKFSLLQLVDLHLIISKSESRGRGRDLINLVMLCVLGGIRN